MMEWILVVTGVVTFLAGPAFVSWIRCLFMEYDERERYLGAWFRNRGKELEENVMYSSNGVGGITETEALLGDLMKKSFPHDGSHDDYHRAKTRFMEWVEKNGFRTISFWNHIAFKKTSFGLNLAPSPFISLDFENRYIVFDDELATKTLALGFLPDRDCCKMERSKG